MSFKFEKLEIWNLAIEYANEVHLMTRKFPKEELFSLTSQYKRAADSIALNISEGSIGQTDAQQRKFMGYAIRSLAECITCLHLAKRRGYLSEGNFTVFYKRSETLFAKMNKFKSSLRS